MDQNYWTRYAAQTAILERNEEMTPLNLTAPTNRREWANHYQAPDVSAYWPYITGFCDSTYDNYGNVTSPNDLYVSLECENSSNISQMYGQPTEMGMHNAYNTQSSTETSTVPSPSSSDFVPRYANSFSIPPTGFQPTTSSTGMPSTEPVVAGPNKKPVATKYPPSIIEYYRKALRYPNGQEALLKAHVLHLILPLGVIDTVMSSMLETFGLKPNYDDDDDDDDDDDNNDPMRASSQGKATGTDHQNAAVPEKLDPYSKEMRIQKMIAERLHPALQCVLKSVVAMRASQCRDEECSKAKRSTKRKQSMKNSSGEESSESKIQRSNEKIEVPITFLNGAAGRLYIFGPAYVMTAERQTQTFTIFIDGKMNTAATDSDEHEVTPREYWPVLKSHRGEERNPLDGADGHLMRQKLIQFLFSKQSYLQEALLWSQSITNDLRRYQVHQQKTLQHIYQNKSLSENQQIHAQPQHQIPQQYSQCGFQQDQLHNEMQRPSYDDYIYMQAQAQSSMYEEQYPTYDAYDAPYSPLQFPPPIPPEMLKISQDVAAVEYQEDYCSVYDEAYPRDKQNNNQAVDLTARTRQIQQRRSRKLGATCTKPGAKLEFIATKLRENGRLENENK